MSNVSKPKVAKESVPATVVADSFCNLESPKKSRSKQLGIHSWHPNYASFSENFVASSIDILHVDKDDLILDPWNGGGTTSIVSNRMAKHSIGIELNPIMIIYSNAKSAFNLDSLNVIKKFLASLSSEKWSATRDKSDSLTDWISPSLNTAARLTLSTITRLQTPNCSPSSRIRRALTSYQAYAHPLKSLLTAALFRTVRKLGNLSPSSNPTWIKANKNGRRPRVTKTKFLEHYESTLLDMLDDLQEYYTDPITHDIDKMKNICFQSDAREIPVRDNSIDAIICSPPYLTRLDYAMSVKPELLLIQGETLLRKIRQQSMGTPMIVNKKIQPNNSWGETCLMLLHRVSQHHSHASKRYYLPNMLQYFHDVEKCLRETIRVLKPGKPGFVVVQSSYYKDVEIDLGKIYTQMIENIGHEATIVRREPVRSHMAHLNSKSNSYQPKKVYYEDVVYIHKNPLERVYHESLTTRSGGQ